MAIYMSYLAFFLSFFAFIVALNSSTKIGNLETKFKQLTAERPDRSL